MGSSDKHYKTAIQNLAKGRKVRDDNVLRAVTDDVPNKDNVYYQKWQNAKRSAVYYKKERDELEFLNGILHQALRNMGRAYRKYMHKINKERNV